jgi:hypothetical protein
MFPIAQFPGADKAIEAASRSGWEAVVLVVITFAICAFAGFLVKHILSDSADREKRILLDSSEREKRMGARIDHLEEYLETLLAETLSKCTTALVESSSAIAESSKAIQALITVVEKLNVGLGSRPCPLSSDEQLRMLIEAMKQLKA